VSFLGPLLRRGPAGLYLRNERTGRAVATDLRTAFDSASRRTGLLKDASLPEGCALIIAPTNAIHTFFMRFSIDVAFVGKDGGVVKTYARLPPWRIAGALRAYAVVELAPGTLAQADTRAGDQLSIAEGPRSLA
jgi:uncharacterized membrane protein (UPF0127 family)